MGEVRYVFKILVRKPEGKRSCKRPELRWEDKSRMNCREIGWKVWTGFIWFRIGTSGKLF